MILGAWEDLDQLLKSSPWGFSVGRVGLKVTVSILLFMRLGDIVSRDKVSTRSGELSSYLKVELVLCSCHVYLRY